MNKKAMAIAVAGVFAAPGLALAQTSTVQIGGNINLFYYKHSPNNSIPTHPAAFPNAAAGSLSNIQGSTQGQSTDILELSEPEMFIRGEEKLGGGLSVWFQCTSSLDAMVGGAAVARGLCGRNSGIGFRGNFGNVWAGNWDTPQKLVFNRARGWWGGTNSFTGGAATLLNNGGPSGVSNPQQSISGVVSPVGAAATATAQLSTPISNGPAEFFRRHSSAIFWHSPVWNGLQVQAAFSAGNENVNQNTANPLSQRMYSLAGHYTSGPLYIGASFERHLDYNPANQTIGTGAAQYAGGDDDNWQIVVGYTFAKQFNIRGQYTESRYDVTNTTNVKANGWGVYADWNVQGPHTLRAQYVKIGDAKGNATVSTGNLKGPMSAGCGPMSNVSCMGNTGAHQWGLAYSYAFSKRTMGSIAYVRMSNDSGATYSKGKVGATAGNSQTSAGVILQHRF
jgi:predicted porin